MKLIIAWTIVLALVAAGVAYYNYMPKPAPIEVTPETGEIIAEGTEIISITGNWRSTQDPNFTREFSADGTVVDRYEGFPEATMVGHYTVVTDTSMEPVSLPPVDGAVLKIEFIEEVLYFIIGDDTTEDHLSLLYLGGNGSLEFKRD